MFRYWVSACGEKPMPERDDIDPVTMPIELLPNIVLVDVLPEARRFRYRVMGTAVARMLGTDWTGRFVDEMPYVHDSVQRQYEETAQSRQPTVIVNEHIRYDTHLMQHKRIRYERLMLPLAEAGDVVTMLLGGMIERNSNRP